LSKVDFDPSNPDRDLVRHTVIRRLREEQSWNHLDLTGEGFRPYVNLQGLALGQFAFYAQEVYWQLLGNGIIAPGYNASNMNLPNFHLTPVGEVFVQTGEWPAYDAERYLVRLAKTVSAPDGTVIAYIAESLRSFERGNYVAAAVMLGIAAERVFILLCESTEAALADPSEKKSFSRILQRYPMKPKLDWVHNKYLALQKKGLPAGFPENALIMVTAVYDIMRSQRNDLGHPRPSPPAPLPSDVLANLQVFPRYYETAEAVRRVLVSVLI